jgi:hypothetical protein
MLREREVSAVAPGFLQTQAGWPQRALVSLQPPGSPSTVSAPDAAACWPMWSASWCMTIGSPTTRCRACFMPCATPIDFGAAGRSKGQIPSWLGMRSACWNRHGGPSNRNIETHIASAQLGHVRTSPKSLSTNPPTTTVAKTPSSTGPRLGHRESRARHPIQPEPHCSEARRSGTGSFDSNPLHAPVPLVPPDRPVQTGSDPITRDGRHASALIESDPAQARSGISLIE